MNTIQNNCKITKVKLQEIIENYNLNKEESILIDGTKRNIISSNDIVLKRI